jgi:hypothetical protein
VRQFVERWYGEDGRAFDVIFDTELARFEVVSDDVVVFGHAAFVEVLRWCMRDDAPVEVNVESIELSVWDPSDE